MNASLPITEVSRVLSALLNELSENKTLSATEYEIAHESDKPMLDYLTRRCLLSRDHDQFRLHSMALPLTDGEQSNKTRSQIESIFKTTKFFYKSHPGKSIRINELAVKLHILKAEARELLLYMINTGLYESCPDINDEDASLRPRSMILNYKTFSELLHSIRTYWYEGIVFDVAPKKWTLEDIGLDKDRKHPQPEIVTACLKHVKIEIDQRAPIFEKVWDSMDIPVKAYDFDNLMRELYVDYPRLSLRTLERYRSKVGIKFRSGRGHQSDDELRSLFATELGSNDLH